jgi:hypothetical protein
MAVVLTGTQRLYYTSASIPRPFTLSAWTYPATVSGAKDNISLCVSNNSSNFATIRAESLQQNAATGASHRAQLNSGYSNYYSSKSGLSAGNWYHIAATYNTSGHRTVWANGVAGSTNTNADTTTHTAFLLGTFASSYSLSADLYVADAGVWNRELDSDEIAELAGGLRCGYVATEDLYAWYRLTADGQDSFGTKHLTSVGSPSYTTDPVELYEPTSGQPARKRMGGVAHAYGGYTPGSGIMRWRHNQSGLILPNRNIIQPDNN